MDLQRFADPMKLVSHFHIRPGDRVADIGAGKGFFLPALVKAAGPDGVVYACEIQKNLVDSLHDTVRREQLNTVQVIWSDVEAREGTKISSDSADVVSIVNAFFQFEDKAAAAREIVRIARDGGKIVVIDWADSFNGLGPTPEAIVTPDGVRAFFEAEGCIYERTFDAGDHHYGLLFRAV